MGRIRTIKPEILTDAKAARLTNAAWRLWVSVWVLADDHGRYPASPGLLGAQVFWGCPSDPDATLGELARAGLIRLYTVHDEPYLEVCGWAKHQRVDNAGKFHYPGPDEGTVSASLRESPRVSAIRGSDLGPRTTDLGPPTGDLGDLAREPAANRGDSPTALATRPSSPPARRREKPHPRAPELADLLREELVTEKPSHALADKRRWATTRPSWVRALTAMLRLRDPDRAGEVIRWLFGDQNGRDPEFRFVVQSPKSLADKFDRLEVAMARPRNGAVRDRAREIWEYADQLESEGK